MPSTGITILPLVIDTSRFKINISWLYYAVFYYCKGNISPSCLENPIGWTPLRPLSLSIVIVNDFLHPPKFSTVRYQLAGPVPWKNITFCIQNGFSSRGVLVLLMFSRRPSTAPVKALSIPIAIFCGTWWRYHWARPQMRTNVCTNSLRDPQA